jgi:ribonuclease HI
VGEIIFRALARLHLRIFPPAKLSIYTDGGWKKGMGSWAFIVVSDTRILHESWGRVRKTGSNRMEFQAAIEALKWLPKGTQATIHSDSQVLVEGLTKKWKRWKADDFMKGPHPLFNRDQLVTLDQLLEDRKVEWKWVRAHSGHFANERCDELCVQARQRR